jgi:hypothetical protein
MMRIWEDVRLVILDRGGRAANPPSSAPADHEVPRPRGTLADRAAEAIRLLGVVRLKDGRDVEDALGATLAAEAAAAAADRVVLTAEAVDVAAADAALLAAEQLVGRIGAHFKARS